MMKKKFRMGHILCSCVLGMSLLASCGERGGPEAFSGTLGSILNQIYEQKGPEMPLSAVSVDLHDADSLKAYTGLQDASQVKEVMVSEPLIQPLAYSLVLVRVEEKAQVETVAQTMREGINPNKWGSVTADDIKVAGCEDVILLVMVDRQLSDIVTASELVEAFQTVCDGSLSFVQ